MKESLERKETPGLLGLGPSAQLDNVSDGQLRELKHVVKAELGGDIDAAAVCYQHIVVLYKRAEGNTYSLAEWIFWLEFANVDSANGDG